MKENELNIDEIFDTNQGVKEVKKKEPKNKKIFIMRVVKQLIR